MIPEGDQNLIIKSVKLVTAEQSGSGNAYFLWGLLSEEGDIPIDVITTLIKGKRWLLKQILFACGIEAKEDDPKEKYKFTEEAVIEQRVIGNIKHKDSTFAGYTGNQITILKAEVKQFKKIGGETQKTEPPKTEKSKSLTSDKQDEEIPF